MTIRDEPLNNHCVLQRVVILTYIMGGAKQRLAPLNLCTAMMGDGGGGGDERLVHALSLIHRLNPTHYNDDDDEGDNGEGDERLFHALGHTFILLS